MLFQRVNVGQNSAENYLNKVLQANFEKLRTIRITQVKANLRLFGVLAEHHFQDLSFPFLSHCPSQWNSDKVQRVSQPDREVM